MEQESKFDSSVVDALFENGVSTCSILYFYPCYLVKFISLPLFKRKGTKYATLLLGIHCVHETLILVGLFNNTVNYLGCLV
jgi:hypothetical protein